MEADSAETPTDMRLLTFLRIGAVVIGVILLGLVGQWLEGHYPQTVAAWRVANGVLILYVVAAHFFARQADIATLKAEFKQDREENRAMLQVIVSQVGQDVEERWKTVLELATRTTEIANALNTVKLAEAETQRVEIQAALAALKEDVQAGTKHAEAAYNEANHVNLKIENVNQKIEDLNQRLIESKEKDSGQ